VKIDIGEDAPGKLRTVLTFERRLDDSVLACAVNMGPEPRRLTQAEAFRSASLYGRLVEDTLEPFGAIVVRRGR